MLTDLMTSPQALIAYGLILKIWIGSRRFRRRNFAGRQVFSSYAASLIIPFLERIFGLLGIVLIIWGALALLLGN